MSDFTIRREDPGQPDIVRLLEDGERNSAELYPAESNHHLPLEALRASNVRFFVARAQEGRPLATGAIVLNGDWVEIKRMWVVPEARGRGLSKAVLDRLIEEARREGARVARLETGVVSHAALGLYRASGFIERGPFASYAPDPLSVFMEKQL
jgi:putative acetyltransferase